MALGLGNNLIRNGGAGNPDKLSLDLQFAADKTLTARKGPTPVFVRGSGATQVGASGLIEYAPENLLLQSEAFGITWAVNNALTVTSNSVTAPDGTLTADSLNFDSNAGSRIIQFAGSAVVSTFSLWLRAAAPTTCILATTAAGSAGDSITVNVTTEWQRFSVVASTWVTGTASFSCRVVNNATGTTGTIFAWGAQLERFSSARTYIPTTTAAVYGARFDHDPVTLACKGLLIEESRTNLVLQSENHPSASWNKTGVTVASASNANPDGVATSNLVTEDLSVGLHRLFQSTAYVSGTSYSISVFLKYAGRQFIAITHPAVAANNLAIFDIQNGTISLTQSGVTTSITAYPNGWYRCVVNGVSSTTGGASHIIQGSTTGGSLTGSYLGLNGPAFYIYGSQVEAGAFATSYIPTTTASVIRSADVCSITGSDFNTVYNQSEVSIFSEFEFQASNASAIVHCNNATSNEVLALTQFSSPSRLAIFVTDGGVTQASTNANANINQVYKSAISAKLNSFQFVLNGVLGTKDTSGTMPTPTQINIGKTQSAVHFNGNIKQIKIFRKELSDAKLQSLTT